MKLLMDGRSVQHVMILLLPFVPRGGSTESKGYTAAWSSLAGAVSAVRVKLVPSWSHHRKCRLHFLSLIILSSVNFSSYQPIILAIIGEITFPLIILNNKCQYLDTWNLGSHLPAGFKHYCQLLATHKTFCQHTIFRCFSVFHSR